MPETRDIHEFLEANLPEYQRRDLLRVVRGFVELLKGDKKHPLKAIGGKNWQRFKSFVCVSWQGADIRKAGKPLPAEPAPGVKEPTHGRCECGGRWVERQNRTKGNYFLGCSKYPKCKQTKSLSL